MKLLITLDSRLRGNDNIVGFIQLCKGLIVYMRQTAHHFSVLEEGIANSVELLKPKGLFLMTREHVADTPQDVEIFKQRHPGTQYGIEEQAYSINRYREALTRGGLTEIRVWGSHDSVINFYPTQPEVVRIAKQRELRISTYAARFLVTAATGYPLKLKTLWISRESAILFICRGELIPPECRCGWLFHCYSAPSRKFS